MLPLHSQERESVKPKSYFVKEKGITIYVESNGRIVTALSSSGEILWSVDPFLNSKLDRYRTDTPVITYIGKSANQEELSDSLWVGLRYNSSQFGRLRVEDGKFTYMGQD